MSKSDTQTVQVTVHDVVDVARDWSQSAEALAQHDVARHEKFLRADQHHAGFLTALHGAMVNGIRERELARACEEAGVTQIAYTTTDAKGNVVMKHHKCTGDAGRSFFERQSALAFMFVAVREADPTVSPTALAETLKGLGNTGMPTPKQVRTVADETKPSKVIDKVTAMFNEARKNLENGGDTSEAKGTRKIGSDADRFRKFFFETFGIRGDGSLTPEVATKIATDGIEDIFKRFAEKQAKKSMKQAEPTTTA